MSFNIYLNNFAGEKRACDFQDNPSNKYIICIAAASGFGIILLFTLTMKRTKLVSYILRMIMPEPIVQLSTNQRLNSHVLYTRDNADDKGVYLILQTADPASG